MSCDILIYTAQTTPIAVLADGTVPLGTIIRRASGGIDLTGNGVRIQAQGYYNVDFGLTVEPDAAGPITAALYLDGEAVPGAIATQTAAAAGDAISLTIPPSVVKLCGCCRGISTLTVRLSAAATVTNAAMRVERAVDYA